MTNAISNRTQKLYRQIPVGILALGAWSLAWNQYGSIAARDWLPYAVAGTLLVSGLLWSGAAERPPAGAVLAIVSLLALAGWNALSLTWSPVPELARDEALLVVFYAAAFLVPVVTLRSEGDRAVATGILATVLTSLAIAAFIELVVAAHPTDDFENGRLTFPISYVNAQAAVLLVGFWPAVSLAADRALRPVLRGGAVGGAAALLAGWMMTQSKGGLVALAVSAIVFFAVRPNRLAAVVPVLIAGALVGGSYGLLTRPFRHRLATDFADAVRDAAWTALAITVVAALAGLAYALADRRITLAPRTGRAIGVALLGALAAALVAGVVAFFAVVDDPAHYASEKWRHFRTLPSQEHGSSHLASLGSNRYDFWRVELALARDHPFAGVGARGFAQEYLADRRSTETPARGHSLELDVLSETGVVGLALLCGAVGIPVALALRRARRTSVAAGLAAAGVYAFAHASVDWVWTFPAFGVVAFALLGVAAAGRDAGTALMRGRVAVVGGLVAVALGVAAFAPPWISSRLTSSATRHPHAAAGDLRWARRLDPLAVEPWLAQASIAAKRADAIVALRRAVAAEPRVSGLRYLLGVEYIDAGAYVAAERELARAHRLDPRDRDIAAALRDARSRG